MNRKRIPLESHGLLEYSTKIKGEKETLYMGKLGDFASDGAGSMGAAP
jgi:hypothetical protein